VKATPIPPPSVLDDTQAGGVENACDNCQADEEIEDASGAFAQHQG
jgi:hypothetical protein